MGHSSHFSKKVPIMGSSLEPGLFRALRDMLALHELTIHVSQTEKVSPDNLSLVKVRQLARGRGHGCNLADPQRVSGEFYPRRLRPIGSCR